MAVVARDPVASSVLPWPAEIVRPASDPIARFAHAGSNRCLDFHGDPVRARLAVFSDGNHHMALHETLRAFLAAHPETIDVFYVTTPPAAMSAFARAGAIEIGNLRLSVVPHVIIGPPALLDQLVREARMASHRPFARGRGVALLIGKDNPKHIEGVASLLRPDVRLFLSNPVTESVSHDIYKRWLLHEAARAGIALRFLTHAPGAADPTKLVYGDAIHHREAPQALADGRADVAAVFYHLALRYTRVFPDRFDMIPLVSDRAGDASRVHCGLVGDGGAFGAALMQFLASPTTAAIYARHGLDPLTGGA